MKKINFYKIILVFICICKILYHINLKFINNNYNYNYQIKDEYKGYFMYNNKIVLAGYRFNGSNRGGYKKCLKLYKMYNFELKEINMDSDFDDDKFEIGNITENIFSDKNIFKIKLKSELQKNLFSKFKINEIIFFKINN